MKQLFIDIETTCDKLGIDLTPEGMRLVGFCPFHTEGRGSFNVYRDTNSWYCFSCKAGGDPLKLVSALVEDVTSWKELIQWFKDDLSPRRVSIRVSPPIGTVMAMFSDDEEIVMPISDESDDPFLTALGIRYAPEGDLVGRHIIPVEINGRLVAYEARDFSGRAIPKTLALPKSSPIHSYLWNIDNIIAGTPIIIVEGIKGAIAVLKFGYLNVVSSFGARLTSNQVALLMMKQPTEVTIAYDADPAGDSGAKEAIVNMLAWTDVYQVHLPDGTDPWDVSLLTWEQCLESRNRISIESKNHDVLEDLRRNMFES